MCIELTLSCKIPLLVDWGKNYFSTMLQWGRALIKHAFIACSYCCFSGSQARPEGWTTTYWRCWRFCHVGRFVHLMNYPFLWWFAHQDLLFLRLKFFCYVFLKCCAQVPGELEVYLPFPEHLVIGFWSSMLLQIQKSRYHCELFCIFISNVEY